jgi:TonB-linked SusC/RagA family outer membrane protein
MTAENQGTPGNDQSQQWLNSTMSTNGIVTGVGTGNALLSYLGRLDWNYAEKYFLSGTFRRDGSSRFGPSNRWGMFPSGTAAWRISQEPFMENVSFVKELKLRYGYGKTGNQEIGNFLYVTTTANGQNYVFNSEVSNGATFLTNGTKGITWESQITHDAGLDAELFKGRVEFTGDYFYKKTYGMLTQPTIPGCVGLKTPPMENLGDVRNRGFEFVLGYNGGKKDFSTDLSLNFTTYENTVMSLGNHNEPIVDVLARERAYVVKTAVGKPVGSFYGYKTNGLFQNMNEVNSYKKANGGLIQPNAKPGDIRYVANSNGDFVKDYIGDPNPDFIFGFTADFTVKNFDLNLFFQGSYGNEIFNAARFTTDDNTAYFGLDRRMLDRWTGEGTTNDPNLARMNVNGADNLLVSDRYVEDGSYVRLKTIQLGYSLPKSFVERIGLAKFRIYVGAQNLFTITRYKGLDPEIGQGEDGNSANRFLDIGIDRGTYPQARTIVTGINLSF